MYTPEKPPHGSILYRHAHPTTESAAASSTARELVGLLTHEDVDRARDRWHVARARWKGRGSKSFRRIRVLWLLVGPGVLVFLGENDAPSMLSYSADGRAFRHRLFHPFRDSHIRDRPDRSGNDRAFGRRHPSRPRGAHLRPLRKILGLFLDGRLGPRKFPYARHGIYRRARGAGFFWHSPDHRRRRLRW